VKCLGLQEIEMRQTGKATRFLGVYQVKRNVFRVRVSRLDPRKGVEKNTERLFKGVSIQEAVQKRNELVEELSRAEGVGEGTRIRVGVYAKSWLDTKLATLSPNTAERYVDALENHILSRLGGLGEFYFDSLKRMDVQEWINKEVAAGYAPGTVRGWFTILRTLVRDAVADLGIAPDPTHRVTLPEEPEHSEPNALTPDELSRFLGVVKANKRYRRNYGLTVVLAFTGLRFCHASALKWEDIDFENGIIRVVRRQVRGHVGPVSRRKRAPAELPLPSAIAEVLKEHRRWLIETQNPGLQEGWVFPSLRGTLKTPSSLTKTWEGCLKAIGLKVRFTVHGLRRTFNDLTRRAGADGLVTRALTGHVTEAMTAHYSTVGLDEKREAVAGVVRLVSLAETVDRTVDGGRN
jgi:integrase/recombinase XerD